VAYVYFRGSAQKEEGELSIVELSTGEQYQEEGTPVNIVTEVAPPEI
jgi:hypothetical protein